jgi:hypothetical protein
MKIINIVKKLVSLSPRQFEREEITKNYITDTLEKNRVDFILQSFEVTVPFYKNYYLKADGKNVECFPTCFRSGKIDKKCDLISSLDYAYECNGKNNINYNPSCDNISLPNFYDSPSLAISKKDVKKIEKAKNIEGFVKVEKKKYTSYNILVGNNIKPKNIFFAHYDCFFGGAIDNASGVAVCLSLILENKEILEENLVVFCGAEELSFDKPNYWGKCFRVFEDRNKKIMKSVNKIIVIDGVGTDKPEIKKDEEIVFLCFGKRRNDKNNLFLITSIDENSKKFTKVYHSKNDTIAKVCEKYLQMAVKKCLNIIK